MKTLEDKLSASIKPGKAKAAGKTRTTAIPAAEEPTAKGPAPAAAAPATAPDRPLHPRRVWPD